RHHRPSGQQLRPLAARAHRGAAVAAVCRIAEPRLSEDVKTRFRIKDHWTEQRMFLRRSVVASCLMVLLVGVLIARLVQLQVVRYDYYSQLSQGNRVRVEP